MTYIHNDSRIYEESYEGLIAHDCSDGTCEIARIDYPPLDLGIRPLDQSASAGTFYIPVELDPNDSTGDEFVDALYAAMREPITDPGSAGCCAPLIVRGNPPVQSRCRWCRNIGSNAKCSNCGGIQ
jgi:hypothetical protein